MSDLTRQRIRSLEEVSDVKALKHLGYAQDVLDAERRAVAKALSGQFGDRQARLKQLVRRLRRRRNRFHEPPVKGGTGKQRKRSGARFVKHADHNQKDHGNWARNVVQEGPRTFAAGVSGDDVLEVFVPVDRSISRADDGSIVEHGSGPRTAREAAEQAVEGIAGVTGVSATKVDGVGGRIGYAVRIHVERGPDIRKHADHNQKDHGNWARGIRVEDPPSGSQGYASPVEHRHALGPMSPRLERVLSQGAPLRERFKESLQASEVDRQTINSRLVELRSERGDIWPEASDRRRASYRSLKDLASAEVARYGIGDEGGELLAWLHDEGNGESIRARLESWRSRRFTPTDFIEVDLTKGQAENLRFELVERVQDGRLSEDYFELFIKRGPRSGKVTGGTLRIHSNEAQGFLRNLAEDLAWQENWDGGSIGRRRSWNMLADRIKEAGSFTVGGPALKPDTAALVELVEAAEEARINLAEVDARLSPIENEIRDLRSAHSRLRRDTVSKFLESEGIRVGTPINVRRRAGVANRLVEDSEHLPAAWVEDFNRFMSSRDRALTVQKKDGGGMFWSHDLRIATDGTTPVNVHELGHGFEDSTLMSDSVEFFNYRTNGGDISSRRSSNGRIWADSFTDTYSGKRYDWGHYEVLSNGLGGLYGGHRGMPDDEHLDWLFGLMVETAK